MKAYLEALLATKNDFNLLLTRVALAVVIFPHGAQKLLGWFGGFGFSGTMDYFTGTLGIPWFLGFLAVIAEFFGSLALLVGLLSRIAALGIGVVMVVAALTVHLPNGFFMNWFGNQAGEGFEYFVLAGVIALSTVLGGGGAFSLDRFFVNRLRRQASSNTPQTLRHHS